MRDVLPACQTRRRQVKAHPDAAAQRLLHALEDERVPHRRRPDQTAVKVAAGRLRTAATRTAAVKVADRRHADSRRAVRPWVSGQRTRQSGPQGWCEPPWLAQTDRRSGRPKPPPCPAGRGANAAVSVVMNNITSKSSQASAWLDNTAAAAAAFWCQARLDALAHAVQDCWGKHQERGF